MGTWLGTIVCSPPPKFNRGVVLLGSSRANAAPPLRPNKAGLIKRGDNLGAVGRNAFRIGNTRASGQWSSESGRNSDTPAPMKKPETATGFGLIPKAGLDVQAAGFEPLREHRLTSASSRSAGNGLVRMLQGAAMPNSDSAAGA